MMINCLSSMLFKPVTLINLTELFLLYVKDSQTSYLFLPWKPNMPFGHRRVICEMMTGSGLKLPRQNWGSSRSAPSQNCSQKTSKQTFMKCVVLQFCLQFFNQIKILNKNCTFFLQQSACISGDESIINRFSAEKKSLKHWRGVHTLAI